MTKLCLKKMRLKAGLSQQQLAAKSGLLPSVISLFEAHKREPGFQNLCKLAWGLGCYVDDLIDWSEKDD